jgi:hypothetical protein
MATSRNSVREVLLPSSEFSSPALPLRFGLLRISLYDRAEALVWDSFNRVDSDSVSEAHSVSKPSWC